VDTLQVGDNLQLSATALDTLGAMVGGVRFNWTTSDAGVATVIGGRVSAVGEGTALVVAEAGGKKDTAAVTVFTQRGWYAQTSNTSVNLHGVFFQSDGRNGWAVGDGGRVLRTSDAGTTWAAQVSNTGFNLNAVWFTSALEGWAAGANGTLIHTVNGGSVWAVVPSGASEVLEAITFATPDTGWAVGSAGVTLRTFDRGATWQKQYPTASALRGVSFAGTRDGWAVGDGGVIVGTHDRGVTWFVVQPSVTAQSLRDVFRRSEPAAWAVGAAGVAPRTVATVDSTAWQLGNAGAAFTLQGVSFASDLIGYAVGFNTGGSGAALRSDDGGATWQAQTANSAFHLNHVFFVDVEHGWAVGESGAIVHTSSGGLP
jgi:photosystem II stability/assembly factor-like uncharacterized protein